MATAMGGWMGHQCSALHGLSNPHHLFFPLLLKLTCTKVEDWERGGRWVEGGAEVRPRRRNGGEDSNIRNMLLAVIISNSVGNILVERFHGVPAEERLHWRSFLVKLGADNLKGAKNEELLVASHKSVYVVYTVLGDVAIYVVGKDEYDELALAEVIFVITSSIKDTCGKPPTERLFLDKYGKICLCLDEIVWTGILENTEKDRIKRLTRLKPPTDF